jgi:hypothetical protein
MNPSNLQKEAILNIFFPDTYEWGKNKLRKMVKGYEYSMSLFGLYNINRRGNIEELKSEINNFVDPKSLSKRFPNWAWELKNETKRGLVFEGASSDGVELKMTLHPLTSGNLTDKIEDLQIFFNLLKVPFPRKYRVIMQERQKAEKKQLLDLQTGYEGLSMSRSAKADVNPIRQRSQFSCVATSTCMALNAVGVQCNEDQVNQVIGAKPMQGARWEEVLACAQYFGCRATLTTPATLTQVKAWTDEGKPVLIAWNPEGRDWSHASLIFDVTGEKGSYVVHVADPNLPNPDKTTREVSEDDFYAKWYEKWPNYLVRRPALMIEREITEDGRQIRASNQTTFPQAVKEIISSVKDLNSNMISRVARVHLQKNKWEEARNNQFDSDQGSELYFLYDCAYGSIGKHIGSKEELIRKYPLFEVLDHDEDPDIDIFIAMKSTPWGKKIAALGHDGKRKSRKAVMIKTTNLLKSRGYYTEASGAIEKLLKKSGFENIKDESVILEIMGHKGDIILEGDGYYSRSLGSIGRHTKTLFGNPIV